MKNKISRTVRIVIAKPKFPARHLFALLTLLLSLGVANAQNPVDFPPNDPTPFPAFVPTNIITFQPEPLNPADIGFVPNPITPNPPTVISDRPIEFQPEPIEFNVVDFIPNQITPAPVFPIPTNPVVFFPAAFLQKNGGIRPLGASEDTVDFPPLLDAPSPFPGPATNATLFGIPGSFPSPGPMPIPPDSPAPCVSFAALGDNLLVAPPDTDGAVGTNHVMTMLNSQVRIQSRLGTNLSTVTLSNFWRTAYAFKDIFDPRVIYDPYANRWVATVLTDRQTTNSSLLIGVSATGDPTGSWTLSRIKIDNQTSNYYWADYPNLGFNKDWVSVSVSLAITTNQLSRSRIYLLNRTNLYAGNVSGASYNLDAATYGFNQAPAITYDTNLSTLYFVQSGNGSFMNTVGTNTTVKGIVLIWTVTGAITNPVLTLTTTLTNLPSADPWAHSENTLVNVARQPGISVGINTGDARMQKVLYRNGSLWCSHTILLPYTNVNRASVQWWQLAPGGGVLQQARIDDSAGITSYAYPTLAVNRFGDVLVGYSRYSTNQYASANYSYRDFYERDNELQNSYVFKAGEGIYYKQAPSPDSRNRWGDYSSTVVDPLNDADFWTIQEYAATPNGTGQNNLDGRWGTWWAKVCVAFPGNDNFANSYLLSGASGSTNGNNIRATKESGEPNHAGNTNTASVWYHWTPPSSGNVIIDTIDSDYATILAVYTGSSVSGLTLVTNDVNSAAGASRVIFNAAASTTYRIAVDGVNGGMGGIVLNYNRPTTPIFVTEPQAQTKYVGDSVTFTSLAIGNPAASYQWRLNGTNINAATSASYTKTSVQTNDGGSYTVVASNTSGSVTSVVVQLTVLTQAATLAAPSWTATNTFRLTIARETNFNYIIQANTNLSTSNWVSLITNVAPFTFTDTTASNYPMRFYRAIYKP